MKKVATINELREFILMLEFKQATELILLKDQFHSTCESLKPSNIIRNSIKEAISAPDFTTNIINGAIGITTGFIAKKVFVGKTFNPLTKLFGILLEIGVAKIAGNNAEGIKSVGGMILNKILHNNSKSI